MNNSALVQKMLQEINKEIEEENARCDIMSFETFWLNKHHACDSNFDKISFVNDLTILENSDQVNYYEELSSYRPGLSMIVVNVKKCIRKLMKFLIFPMVGKQNIINRQNTRINQQLRAFVNYQEEVNRTVEVLNRSVQAGQESLRVMDEKVRALEAENRKLREQIDRIGG